MTAHTVAIMLHFQVCYPDLCYPLGTDPMILLDSQARKYKRDAELEAWMKDHDIPPFPMLKSDFKEVIVKFLTATAMNDRVIFMFIEMDKYAQNCLVIRDGNYQWYTSRDSALQHMFGKRALVFDI